MTIQLSVMKRWPTGGLKYFNLDLQANTSRGGNVKYEFEFFGPAIFGYVIF